MQWPRWLKGLTAAASVLTIPVSRFWHGSTARLYTPSRAECGLVLLLPGIQGESCMEFSLACGLEDAGVEMAIEVFDWTTGCWWLFPLHLRGLRRNRRRAEKLAERILAYQQEYPGRPVHVIGHSGGAGLALLALEAMPCGCRIERLILLAAAVSPRYDLRQALEHLQDGIWNFSSWGDLFFLGLATLVLGTFDGRHTVAAGARGFTTPETSNAGRKPAGQLHERPFCLRFLKSWNLGGHFSCTNRVFAAECLAPLLNANAAAPITTQPGIVAQLEDSRRGPASTPPP